MYVVGCAIFLRQDGVEFNICPLKMDALFESLGF